MKKITELTETRWRTVYYKDAYGNRQRDTEEFLAYRQIQGVGWGIRFTHLILDGIAYDIILMVINYFFALLKAYVNINPFVSLTYELFAGVGLLLLYPILSALCEYKWQRTPAKFITKTMVVDEYGNKPELSVIILRTVIRIVPLDAVSFLLSDDGIGWHDRWSKTWVLSVEEIKKIKELQAEQEIEI